MFHSLREVGWQSRVLSGCCREEQECGTEASGPKIESLDLTGEPRELARDVCQGKSEM